MAAYSAKRVGFILYSASAVVVRSFRYPILYRERFYFFRANISCSRKPPIPFLPAGLESTDKEPDGSCVCCVEAESMIMDTSGHYFGIQASPC